MIGDIVNTVATCLSAIAACIATYLSARALKDNNATKRAEFESARPYFTFTNFGLRRPVVAKALSSDKELLDPRVATIEGLIVNDGQRPASDVSGAILILPIKNDAKLGTSPIGIADDAAPKSEWHVGTAQLDIFPEDFVGVDNPAHYQDPGFFVTIAVRYRDPLSAKEHIQNSFMRWPGISNGVVSSKLVAASREEKDMLLARYSDFLQPHLGSQLTTRSSHAA